MAEKEGKSEKPTPRRIQKAREEGNVPKSQEVNSVAVLLGGILFLYLFGGYFFNNLTLPFLEIPLFISPDRLNGNDIVLFWEENLKHIFLSVVLLLLLAFSVALISNIAQFGVVFTTKPLKPKLEKLNPINGLKNIFFSLNSLFELIKNLVKIAVIVAVAYFFVKSNIDQILSLYKLPLLEGIKNLTSLLLKLSLYIALTGAVIAAIDYSYRRWKWYQDLMMSRHELKEEMKETEGNPEVKREIRRRMRQISTRRMLQEVPKATVVVTNPTHFAVALKYDPEKDLAPKVVSKGADRIAQRIIEIARQHGVEIYRDPPLARALYQSVEVGDVIPEKFYQAVAKIIAYIYRKKNKNPFSGT
jgi:flagellar biosynthetic protein FlhB